METIWTKLSYQASEWVLSSLEDTLSAMILYTQEKRDIFTYDFFFCSLPEMKSLFKLHEVYSLQLFYSTFET